MKQILALGWVASCAVAMAADPYPHAHENIGEVRALYDGLLDPQLLINTARNTDRLFPTRTVESSDDVRPLPAKSEPFTYFQYTGDGDTYDLFDYLAIGRVSGLLVLHQGQIAYENYLLGNSQATRWMSMSVVKSMTAMLVGAAIKDGFIDGVNDPVVSYLPQLKGSAYEGVTVKDLLLMASGVAWDETYTDPASDRRAMLEAQLAQQPGEILGLMAALPRASQPGTHWNYSTGETHVVGALVRASTGVPVADYLSRKVWQPAGMESDAEWWLEAPGGLEVGGSGLSATLRDYARFGLFMLENGRVNDQRVLPDTWMQEATRAHRIGGESVAYGYMLWVMPDGAYAARGLYGQWVYVNPARYIVIAMWGAQPKPTGKTGLNTQIFLIELAAAVDRFYSDSMVR
ncbi:MAG: serine hydrolase [Pseudomonadota bacterium]